MSEHISDISRLPEMYRKTCAKLADKLYHGYDVVIREKTIQTSVNKDYNISIREEQAIIEMLQSGEGLVDYIEGIFEKRRRSHIDASRLQIVFAELLNILNRVLREDGLDMMDIYPDFNNLFERISMMTLNEMKECIIDLYQKVFAARSKINCASGLHDITKQARKYINSHYAKNISLCDIAEEFGVTSSYLSRVFKEDVGKTIVEYLNCFRIQRAQKMIMDGIKLKDLYERIGFNSHTYFYTVFKQITGQTPLQYKRKLAAVNKAHD
jgi:two-component system response regulator YesN